MGDGIKAAKLIIVKPIPIATGLSFSSTHLKICKINCKPFHLFNYYISMFYVFTVLPLRN